MSLKDVYTGKVIKFPLNVQRVCTDCTGKGCHNIKECPACDGKGYKMKVIQSGIGMIIQTQQTCHQCSGKGKMIEEKDICNGCKGKKMKTVQKILEVPIGKLLLSNFYIS